MKINKILVTGSSGMIGTYLCEKLLQKRYDVIGLDYKKNKWDKLINKITIKADLRNKEFFKILPKDIDLIIHLAANARVYDLVKNPILARDNFETLFNILEFSRINKIKRIIFSSSREVYGNSDKIINKEDDVKVKNSQSPYSSSKLAGESLIRSYKNCFQIDFIIFRFSNVYGMYDESDRIIPLFIKLCKNKEDIIIFGKEKLLDFTYIDDTVQGMLKSIEKFEKIKNNVFNLAYGTGVSLLDLAKLIKKSLNSSNKIIIKNNRPGEVVKYIADIKNAKEKIGFQPKYDIIKGIENTLNWYNRHF